MKKAVGANEIIGIVGAIVVLGIMFWTFKGLVSGGDPETTRNLTQEARQLVEAAGSGRYDDVYALMSPSYRSGVSADDFREALANNAQLRNVESIELKEYDSREDRARVTFAIESDAGRIDAVVIFSRRDGDDWTVAGLSLAGVPAIPQAAGGTS